MSDFDFLIPLSLDALREAQSTRQYAVKDVSSASEIPKKIQECQIVFRQDGAKFIVNSRFFDALYSVLVHFDAVEEEFRNRAWELLIKAMAKVTADLALLLDGEALVSRDKKEWLNVLKMTTYLACTITECFEKYHLKPSTDTLEIGKKKKAPKKSEYGIDWEEERNRMLLQLFSILHHPLHRLWDPPVVEEDYVNLIANCCYKILETPSMNLVRSKPSRDSIFQVLGLLVKKFNHGLACSLKLMQLLQHFEHLVVPVATGVISIMEEFGNTAVLSELVREIAKIDHRDMAKDSSGMRNYSQFLVEVSEKSPQVIMPSLSLLINFLDEEYYGLRNCVLSILGSIVLRVLNGEQLDKKSKDLRDQCLDLLEDHLHDIHAFVRSKILQVWQELVVEKAVPLARQRHVMQLVLGRLKDKSSNVRRHAIQLLTAFLKGNPFAAKLPLEELEKQLSEEKTKLHEMAPELAKEDDDGREENQPRTPRDAWLTILPLVITDVYDILTEDADEDMDEEDSLPSDVTLNSAVSDVAEALCTNKYVRAIKLLKGAFEAFDGAPVFQTTEDQMDPKLYEDETDEELNAEQIKYLIILERIFLSAKAMEQKKQGVEEKKGEEEKKGDEEGKKDKQNEDDQEEKKEKEDVTKQKMLVNYLKDSVAFSEVIHDALPIVCQMLASKQVSDVLEAVQFFVTAFEFGLLNAMSGVRRMLSLVWTKEQSVKDAVVEAYQRLYINVDAPSDRVRAQHIVRNLSALITGATLGERTSMEEIVAQFVNTGDISKNCITLLWERFTKAIPDTTDDDARSALALLAMCANSEESIVKSNIPVLVMCGLGERGEKDFALVKETCQALLKLGTHKPKTESPDPPYRLNSDHDIFVRLCDILVKGLSNLEDRQYSPMAIDAISTIYSLAEKPDAICGDILKRLCTVMLELQKEATEDQENKNEDAESTGSSEPLFPKQGFQSVPMGLLSRFFVVVGQMAIRQLIHLDTHIFSELKRRNHMKELHQEEKMKNKKNKKSKKRKSLATSALEAQKELSGSQQSTTGGDDIDEEMGLTGAVADDMEAEYIRNICETEIITGDNLLSFIRPLIWSVCINPNKYPDPGLLTAATLALSKFMMVSAEVCEDNLQLLFTILEKSEEPVIRANIIIALGDLSFRFPNQTEPWTPKIYARLRDHCPMVRRNTLTVLTHLILNDMIKVKGQISDIALCITDDDNRIMGLSKLFFSELSHKGNALYNVMPDIISRLSDPELKIEESRYRHIIGHIFGLVQKDSKMEMLVEKLCHRYQATTSPRQWRDITFCLSLLQFNDKCIRKLSESFACYSDKLHEPEVWEFFLGILANARKLAKPEAKMAIEELEGRMQECHSKGVEDEAALTAAQRTKNKYNKKSRRQSSDKPTLHAGGGRSSRKAPTRSSRRKAESSEDEDGDYEPEEEENNAQLHPVHRENKENNAPATRKSSDRGQSKKKLIESSDEEEEEAEGKEANVSKTTSGGGGGSSDDFKSTSKQRKNVRIAKPLTESRTVRSSRRK